MPSQNPGWSIIIFCFICVSVSCGNLNLSAPFKGSLEQPKIRHHWVVSVLSLPGTKAALSASTKNMNVPLSLKGKHLRAYETIFQHPISHNLEWRAVRALLEHLGQVAVEPNGNLKVIRNGQTLVLHQPHSKDVADADAVMMLRHFLEQSETVPAESDENAKHWLLVIDHHEARIFRSKIHGAPPQLILPHDPTEHFDQARNSQDVSRGQEKPEPNSFFELVAEELKAAGQILIFGTGTGTSNEMDQFVAWLKIRHPHLAGRIIGSLVVDEQHLTNDQLLAKARDFYAKT